MLTTFDPISPVPPITTIFILLLVFPLFLRTVAFLKVSVSRFGLTFDEREQVGVDDVGLRRRHSMGEVFVCLQRAVLEQLGGEWTRGLIRHNLVVLAMHDQNGYRDVL